MNNESNPKITADHLGRKATVYVRQSSAGQVKHNKESQGLQYALAQRARALGFSQVDIIDADLGASAGLGARARKGFNELLADVALGKVGLILSREVSRLSRTDKDWCQLIELCRFFNTLIGDADQLYDVNQMDDQLILGIKGTLSVVELSVLKMRMLQGKEAKARRGKLSWTLTPGYVLDLDGRVVKDPDQRIQQAISLIFRMFHKLGSLRKTHRWLRENGIEVPVNKSCAGQFQLTWQAPSSSFVRDVVNNPFYAGAYVYGRRPVEIVIRDGKPHKKQRSYVPPEEVNVFIKDHHEGYISWETYEQNRAMLKENSGNFGGDEGVQAARDGQSLLAGLLRCGRCGRKLHVRYWGGRGKQGRYVCVGTYQHGGEYCLGFAATKVDQRIGAELLRVISPLGIEASVRAAEELDRRDSEQQRALRLQLQQLEYEAQRAFEQYNRVDPANRLVADTLERRWNDKLQAVDRLKCELGSIQNKAHALDQQDNGVLTNLGQQFVHLWDHPDCSMALKKRITRLLIHEVIANIDEDKQQLQFVIHWQGGAHTRFEMPRPRSAAHAHKTDEQDLDLVRKMAPRYPDLEIARVLSSLGRKTGKGQRWTHRSVAYLRKRYRLGPYDPDALGDMLSLTQATKHCGVSDGTIKRLIEAQILPAAQVAPYAPLEIKREDLDSEPVRHALETLKRTGKLMLGGASMANQERLFS
jgi:DNA invertase Pin-like site-specific DNA recombinase